MSEPIGKSDSELVIETFVDRMTEIHPDLDWQEFYDAVSGYVQEAVSASESDEEEESDDEG